MGRGVAENATKRKCESGMKCNYVEEGDGIEWQPLLVWQLASTRADTIAA